MLEIRDVPYRMWTDSGLVDCREGKKVMALMAREMKAGKAVDFQLSHPINPSKTPGEVYDTISLTVLD